MVGLIDDNQIEKISRELMQPLFWVGSKLLHIRDNKMGFLAD